MNCENGAAEAYLVAQLHSSSLQGGSMNKQRVLIGGVLAGVVYEISHYIFKVVLFRDDVEGAIASLNAELPRSAGPMAQSLAVALLLGIVAVWLYATMRPRLGAGVGPAVTT